MNALALAKELFRLRRKPFQIKVYLLASSSVVIRSVFNLQGILLNRKDGIVILRKRRQK
jgi:hypothetical protein